MPGGSILAPRAREALNALESVLHDYRDIFRAECSEHDSPACLCEGRICTAWVVISEWSALEDGSLVVGWNAGVETGFHTAVGLIHAADMDAT